MSNEVVLETRDIVKTFPGVVANDQVSIKLRRGEVMALLGENGAGKTTLVNIIYGLYHPDSGQVLLRGKSVELDSPKDAIAHGIGMVHQHFMLIPVMTVTENVMLGVESTMGGVVLDRLEAAHRIRAISEQYGLEVDPDAYVGDLPVGVQQRVEIIKTLYRNADILILDEPTAVLTPQEIEELFDIIRSLVDQGKSIIFISHKLREVLTIANRITVLRDGRVVGTTEPAQTNQHELATMMVGREVLLEVERKPTEPAGPVLEVENLRVRDDLGSLVVKGVTFSVEAGEILGLAGVQGNGQTELIEAITGLRAVETGHVCILGDDTTNATPRQILEKGVGHIPEDRQHDGLVLGLPVMDNLVLNTYHQSPFAQGIVVQRPAIEQAAMERVRQFDVRAPSVHTPVSSLSGGNQQKVIVARELSRPIRLLIAAQPTRGLDVGSIEYIHRRLLEKRDQGCAVLLASTELDEIMALADRIAVIYEGRIMNVLPAAQATRRQLGLLMAGVQPSEDREHPSVTTAVAS